MSLSALRCKLMDLARDLSGIASLEYSLITVVVGGVIIACINSLGTSLSSSYGTIGSKLMELAGSVN